MIVLPVPSLLSPPVRAELRQADLITNEECETLKVYRWQWGDLSDLVRVQCVKSPAVMAKSADVLRRYGFESNLLAGRQSSPSSICLCYVVQWSLLMTDTL